MKIPFYKCNGNGNSFIIIKHNDILDKFFYDASVIKYICTLNKEKVDGFVLINNKKNNIKMDYFNNDGSWETLCLNGLRCASLVLGKKNNSNKINIFCNKVLYKTKILMDNMISVNLNKPKYNLKNIEVESFIGHYIDVGAKHFVIEYNNKWPSLKKLEIAAKRIRYNKSIFPDGINVNFYKIIDSNVIEVKTYEKGVESMMDSCASGSYACAFHYFSELSSFGKINVKNIGGNFQIIFDKNYMNNLLIGKAEIEYEDFLDTKLIGEK